MCAIDQCTIWLMWCMELVLAWRKARCGADESARMTGFHWTPCVLANLTVFSVPWDCESTLFIENITMLQGTSRLPSSRDDLQYVLSALRVPVFATREHTHMHISCVRRACDEQGLGCARNVTRVTEWRPRAWDHASQEPLPCRLDSLLRFPARCAPTFLICAVDRLYGYCARVLCVCSKRLSLFQATSFRCWAFVACRYWHLAPIKWDASGTVLPGAFFFLLCEFSASWLPGVVEMWNWDVRWICLRLLWHLHRGGSKLGLRSPGHMEQELHKGRGKNAE